jgi:hypothetical protein|tara:strand:- start:146 stop:796 length:651 start_codon:yes stop_codon:yes gene_type:complete
MFTLLTNWATTKLAVMHRATTTVSMDSEIERMTIEQLEDVSNVFVGWQCRLRQHSVRRSDGRPSSGMCPQLILSDDQRLGSIVTVLVKHEPEHAIAQFQHLAKQTNDPVERYESAVRMLQNVYYQYPREFSDQLTASFNVGSSIVKRVLGENRCRLVYEQANQRYTVPCRGQDLDSSEPAFLATYWHNALFNPKVYGRAEILQFIPDWSDAVAETI